MTFPGEGRGTTAGAPGRPLLPVQLLPHASAAGRGRHRAVALGLCRTVVGGEKCLRFSPRHPRHLLQFSSVKDMLENSQREFWALDLSQGHLGMDPDHDMREERYPLAAAEQDAALGLIASTYSPENGAVYDGISRYGVRLVSFAPMLKHGFFPLADLTRALLQVGEQGMGGPVEIEFAVTLEAAPGEPQEFGFLQIRPLAVARDTGALGLGQFDRAPVCCASPEAVLGNGVLEGIRDLVVVDAERFDRSRSAQVAREVTQVNAELVARGAPTCWSGWGGGGRMIPGWACR